MIFDVNIDIVANFITNINGIEACNESLSGHMVRLTATSQHAGEKFPSLKFKVSGVAISLLLSISFVDSTRLTEVLHYRVDGWLNLVG